MTILPRGVSPSAESARSRRGGTAVDTDVAPGIQEVWRVSMSSVIRDENVARDFRIACA